MEVKVLVQNCAENQEQKSGLLALSWSLYHRLFFLLTFSSSYFSQFIQQTYMKHLQHLGQCDKYLKGCRDADDNFCPLGLCSLVEMCMRD